MNQWFYQHEIEEPLEVSAMDRIEVNVWIAKDVDSKSNVDTYSGSNGNGYENISNTHMGLFKIDSAT